MSKFKNLLWLPIILLFILLAAYGGYRLAFRNLIFPKVAIAGVDTSGMDKDFAEKLITTFFSSNPSKVVLFFEGKEVGKMSTFQVEPDVKWAVNQAYGVGRNGNILTQAVEQVRTLTEGRDIVVPIKYEAEELSSILEQIEEEMNRKPLWPKIVKVGGEYKIQKGIDGVEINKNILSEVVQKHLALPGTHNLEVPVSRVNTQENPEMANKAVLQMNEWKNRSLFLNHEDFELRLGEEDLMNLFGLSGDTINGPEFEKLVLRTQKEVEREAKDAVFVFENDKVKEFQPEIVGVVIDLPKFKNVLAEALYSANSDRLQIPVILSFPEIRTGDINDLGIKELIGEGKSSFSHSIPGRVFNVALASKRINGTLVAPGEEFSFGKAVGDISKATGYQSAYIISEGKTVLGDGGGVCQVSTTAFRAALNSGLPITERKAHAYRVGYYEQDSKPGIDATVFIPSADLKFKNDTGHHILIQTEVDTKKYTMNVKIYGTSDGRKATVSEPKISSQTPPPPTLYIDDPTLPVGTMKQIDFSAWGAKISFDYVVERDGEKLFEKTFFSNYQPWQAVYLRGTKV